ncbi:MAG: hypothetical protein GY950_11025 [bacterium]|nr:hypothetical protein [bacterium]
MTKGKFKITVPAAFLVLLFIAGDAISAQKPLEKEKNTWTKAGFQKPKIEFIDTGRFYRKNPQTFTHTFDLTLVMFRNTGWTKKVILKRLKKVTAIYARCGVKIGKIKFVTAGAPENMIDFSRPGNRDQKIAKRTPPTAKPILYYFRSIPMLNAYAWAETTDNDEIPRAIKNTAWFSLSVTMDLNRKIRHPDYISEAHELGHILLDTLAHTPKGEKNLMAEDHEHVNGQLTAEQCRKIKAHHLVTPRE